MIADDQQLIRESLKIILDSDPDFEVVKVVGSGQEVLDTLETESIDIILMDVRMPNMSGVDCTRLVKKKYPNIKVIILTTFDDDEYIYDALKYGASGYLLKGCSLEELSLAIHNVLSGGACFNPNVACKIIAQIGHGYSNKEIAQKLGFSEGTIRNYLSVILDKLDLRDRTQLAIWYLSRGNK